jgi:hypothetical protein
MSIDNLLLLMLLAFALLTERKLISGMFVRCAESG